MALIIDLTRMLAGPFGTQMLGDLGHDVIKVEQPRIGDATRRNPPYVNGVSAYFFSANRNKKAVIIDLKDPEGRELLLDLVRRADVVFENFRPGVMEALGLSYAELRAVNPDIVHISITGFGSWGDLREKISFDVVGQAISGAMMVSTPDAGEPIKPAIPMADLGAGIYGVLGTLRALLERQHGGGGCHLEVSLLDVMLAFSANVGEDYLLNERGDEGPRFPAPNGLFPTADEHIAIAAYTDEAWRLLVSLEPFAALDVAEFSTALSRMENREELERRLGDLLRARPSAEWLAELASAGVVATGISDMGTVFSNEGLIERGMLPVIDHPVIGSLPAIGDPIRIDEGPGSDPAPIVPAPRHGQDTEQVLRDYLGLDDARIADLVERRIVLGLVPEKL